MTTSQSSKTFAGDSASLAIGTALSRGTGFARMLIIPAIFGATAIGDMFLAVNSIPQTLFATFGGQALSSILVPVIVRALSSDPRRADLLGRTSLSVVGIVLTLMGIVGMALHRPIAAALASGFEASADATDIAALLLLLMIPQIVLYGVISVLIALQHARGRFLLPSIAPTIENVGLIVAVVVVWRTFDDVHLATSANTRLLVSLGFGSTIALLLHVIVQIFGAVRAGASVKPARPRSEPELTALRGQVRSNLAWTLLFGPRLFGLIIAAGWAGAGGIQAIQIGYLVQNLPTALVGYPVAAAILPRLSRRSEGSTSITSGYSEARDLVLWLLVPMAAGMIFLSGPLGRTLAVGRFAEDDGAVLISAALIGLAIAAASEATYEVARQATLAFGDITGFKRSIWIRGLICLIGLPLMPMIFDDTALLLSLGAVVSLSDLAALITIDRPLRLVADSSRSGAQTAVRAIGASLVAGLVALATASALEGLRAIMQLGVSTAVFGLTYLAAAWLLSNRGRMVRTTFDRARSEVASEH